MTTHSQSAVATKTTFPLFIQVPAYFESSLSICCLAPQHIFRFFHFSTGFSFALANFGHYSTIIVSSSSTPHRAIEGKITCDELLLLGNLDPSSLTPGGSVVPFNWVAVSGVEIIFWRSTCCLRAFMS